MTFPGPYETHLTVLASTEGDLAALHDFASARNLKFTHIVLATGASPSQPMLTLHAAESNLPTALAAAAAVGRELGELGLPVIRVKLETAASTPGVPQTDDQARMLSGAFYFEHHVKLLTPSDPGTLAAVDAIARDHDAHPSRNARRTRDDGREERFLTQRHHRAGRLIADAALASLVRELRAARHTILETESEYVVHDSNLQLDAGWASRGDRS